MRMINEFSSRGAEPAEYEEGQITKEIERYTTAVPSGTFLTLGIAAILGSALLQIAGRKEDANFIGQWVPTILIMGLYNKLVKLHGSE